MSALHPICSLISYAAFLIAFLAGMLFLVQERQLKRKTMGFWFHRLPSLELLDQLNFLAIGIGFWLLSIGVASGLVESRQLLGRWWTGDPKASVALALWLSYFILWLVRLRSTLRGRRVALLSVLGFSLVLFTFVGVSRLLHSGHPYL